MNINKKFKHKVRQYMNKHALSPNAFSKQAGISNSVTQNILNSENPNPTIETAIRVAETIQCTPNELLGVSDGTTLKVKAKLYKSVCDLVLSLKEIEGCHIDELNQAIFFIYKYCIENNLSCVDHTYTAWYIRKVFSSQVIA